MACSVRLEDVCVAYPNTHHRLVVDQVSLTAQAGSVVAIMGGSGSGKTTLLRLVSGLLRPSRGTVQVLGQSLAQLSTQALGELRKNMGVAFQFGALFMDLTVFENVAFPLREMTLLPEAAICDLVCLKLEAVGLRGAQHLMPAELSGGMVKRVAIARAVALDPQLILYDEPFAGLDPISLGIVGRLIRQLNDALGACSLMVTHDVHQSMPLVDYVYLLSAGRVVAEGTPQHMQKTSDPFVRQFMDGVPDGPVPFHYPVTESLQEAVLRRGRL